MRVILIVCDALRFDYVTPDMMPNLIQWANRGVWFENCLSCGTYTKMAVSWILCQNSVFKPEQSWTRKLSNAGFETSIIHSNPALYDFREAFTYEVDTFKLERGIIETKLREKFRKTVLWKIVKKIRGRKSIEDLGYNRAETILNYAEQHLDETRSDSFSWIHLMDTHIGYFPPDLENYMSFKEAKEINQKIVDSIYKGYNIKPEEQRIIKKLYAGEVKYLDTQLSIFLNNRPRDDFIIITSDHGDELGEYGKYSHHNRIIPQLIHVPLIIGGNVKSQQIEAPSSHLDIAPIIHKIAGLENSTEIPDNFSEMILE